MTAFTQTLDDPAGLSDGARTRFRGGVSTDRAGAVDVVSFSLFAAGVDLFRSASDDGGVTDAGAVLILSGVTTDLASSTDTATSSITSGGTPVAQVFTNSGGASDSGSALAFEETLSDFAGGVSTITAVSSAAPAPAATPFGMWVDWARDGLFSGTLDDVSDDNRSGFAVTYGREQATATSPVAAGRGSFDLDNTTRMYSPRNTTSPLYGKLKPARPVLITRNVGTSTFTIFRGHTDDSGINPDVASKRVTVGLVDYLADFRGVNITTGLSGGIRTGAAVNLVLDAVGWTGPRMIDTGATTIPWFWCQAADVYDTLQQIVASEGPPALLTVDSTGAIVFRDRHHRLRNTASKTSQATWAGDDAAAEPVMAPGFTYSEPWENVINTVSFTVDERAPSGGVVQVWSTDETITIGASQSYSVVIATSDPFYGAVTPANGIDYTLERGTVTAASLSRTSGASTSVTLTAGAGGATITGLQLRAYSVAVVRTRIVSASNSASALEFGTKGVPSGSEPVWASYWDALALANLYVDSRRQPLPVLSVRFVASDTQVDRLTAVLTRDLSDRVTVVEPETALADPFFVETISHTVPDITQHEIVFGLEGVSTTVPSTVFILGTSVIGGSDPLGY